MKKSTGILNFITGTKDMFECSNKINFDGSYSEDEAKTFLKKKKQVQGKCEKYQSN